MRLCYRGVEYDYNPPSLEVKEQEILGKYRGRPLHFNYVSHVPVPQPVADSNLSRSALQHHSPGAGSSWSFMLPSSTATLYFKPSSPLTIL